jgi:poly(beta-D-mannuronate) lyase
MFKFNTLFILLLFAAATVCAKDYPIHNAAELAFLNLKPGDRAIIKPGNWANQQLVFKARGTRELPITLVSSEPGKILITGNSSLVIDGQYLIVDGLSFAQGYAQKGDVVTFSKETEGCRLTNSSIVDFNPTDKRQDNKWISLNGYHNRVDHCHIKGKTNQGTTLVVWVADKPNYHQIDHNLFDVRPDLGSNGGETIRIGTSQVSMNDSFTTVEENIFYQCNGEMEILSNKSGHNTIRNNLFYECIGTLTLREGGFADVYGNYMIGNNLRGTGGIRIIGEGHKVHHNYFHGLTGTNLKAVISIMDAKPNSDLKGYMQVKNAEIKNNTIVNCAEAFNIGAGKRDGRELPPQNITIANNLVLASTPIVYTDQPRKLKIKNNLLYNIRLAGDLPDGFDMEDPQLEVTILNLYQPQGRAKIGAPVLNAEQKALFDEVNIGPVWYKSMPVIRVK